MVVAGVVTLGFAGLVLAAKKELVTSAAEEQKWIEVPDSGGVQVTNFWGDFTKGAYGGIAKLPAGSTHPLHTHSKDIKCVVVSGTFQVGLEGEPEKKLGPGSYFFVPGGLKHTSSCAAGAPCVLFQEQTGKFDVKPVAPAPAK
jgi:quercetin dioxygenase-like cupin family protein